MNVTKLLKYLKGSALLCAILAPLSMCLEVAMDLVETRVKDC